MALKKTYLWIIFTVFFVFLVFYLVPTALSQKILSVFIRKTNTSITQKEPENMAVDLLVSNPVRLVIPIINVNAPIEYVGLTSKGAMDAPEKPTDVAWFSLGVRPGEIGSAVIAGHYGELENGEDSIFQNLNILKKGDKIFVEDKNGGGISFLVRESKTYDSDANASDIFVSNDGKSHLNLITCEGIWDGVLKTYSNRLIVFADRID